MEISTVCILGGGGFVGRHICQALAAKGYRVRVPTRNRERAKALTMLPTAEVVEADVHDPAVLERLAYGSEAMINLVGVLHDGRGKSSFAAAHVELAAKVVAACRDAGVRRLLHMSALNAAPDAPSAYLRSKSRAEEIVRGSHLEVTVFRPSAIFGPEDTFLNLFAALTKRLPVVLLGSPDARFQPVYVEDVAQAFLASLADVGSFGAAFDLCGPREYKLRELVAFAARTAGHPRPIAGLSDALSYWQAFVLEHLPGRLLTRDNYRSMKLDAVCRCPFPFGIRPAALEAVAPAWLAPRPPRRRVVGPRRRAGR